MDRVTMYVCPHDTAAAPERWFRLAQYLNQQIELSIRLQVSLDFEDFHTNLAGADLANRLGSPAPYSDRNRSRDEKAGRVYENDFIMDYYSC